MERSGEREKVEKWREGKVGMWRGESEEGKVKEKDQNTDSTISSSI